MTTLILTLLMLMQSDDPCYDYIMARQALHQPVIEASLVYDESEQTATDAAALAAVILDTLQTYEAMTVPDCAMEMHKLTLHRTHVQYMILGLLIYNDLYGADSLMFAASDLNTLQHQLTSQMNDLLLDNGWNEWLTPCEDCTMPATPEPENAEGDDA